MAKKNRAVAYAKQNEAVAVFPELQRNVMELPLITPPQAGGNVVITCPVGGHTYEKVFVPHNIAESKITDIEVLVNDRAIWKFKNAKQMRELDEVYKEVLPPANTAERALVFNFERLNLKENERKVLGIGTADIQKLSISFKIAADVVNPEISAYAFVGRVTNIGLIRIINTIDIGTAVGGTIPLVEPFLVNKSNQAKVLAFHILRNDVSEIEILRGQTVANKMTAGVNKWQLKQAGRAPNGNFFTFDFCTQNTITNALTYSNDASSRITIRPTLSGGAGDGRCDILAEYVGTLGSA